jgi:hypothetical protein
MTLFLGPRLTIRAKFNQMVAFERIADSHNQDTRQSTTTQAPPGRPNSTKMMTSNENPYAQSGLLVAIDPMRLTPPSPVTAAGPFSFWRARLSLKE